MADPIPKQTVVEDPKKDWFVAINPNGRLPAIVDPNTSITLWESGAILEYLVETYDKEGKLTVADVEGKWQLKQYLHFQTSGQGPYYGQAVWFHRCPENIPLVKQRYIGVLNNILKGKQYLVGDKCTYADIAFVPWNFVIRGIPFFQEPLWKKYEIESKYPDFMAWHERLAARPAVKRAYGS